MEHGQLLLLVRLPLVQRELDLKAGHNTAGYISGYRGSPLGGYDLLLERNKNLLEEHHVKFQPGVNEDLAGTALWGPQQPELGGEGKYDGFFEIAFIPYINTQKIVTFTHNGKDKIAFDLALS